MLSFPESVLNKKKYSKEKVKLNRCIPRINVNLLIRIINSRVLIDFLLNGLINLTKPSGISTTHLIHYYYGQILVEL